MSFIGFHLSLQMWSNMINNTRLLLLSVFICIVTSITDQLHRKVQSCHIGDVIRNKCNKCLCTSKGIFECIAKPCDEIKDSEPEEETCSSNQLYVQNAITCICTKYGTWPHKSCYKSFQSLPTKNIETHKCEPNTYVLIDCNVCKCSPDGDFLINLCTKNYCEENTTQNTRRNDMDTVIKNNNVYTTCKAKTWYSLAPCQFCYCVNENKLVCNTGNNNNNNNLVVGTYDLHICGKELIREAEELVPENHKSLRTITEPYFSSEEVTTTKNTLSAGNKLAVVNEDSNENNPAIKSNVGFNKSNYTYKYEYDSDQDEHILSNTTISALTNTFSRDSRIVTKELVPTLDSEDSNSDQDSSKEYSNEIVVDFGPFTTPGKINNIISSHKKLNKLQMGKSKHHKSTKVEDHQNSGNTLQLNIPNLLSKVFEMAWRKSMVSLSSSTKCTPGATSTKDCNMCFCLKNGKLLCTTNKCK